ncbi:MAG: LD-carboxypeptidase [Candidatus Aquirickettsiella gammari]|jgi:muramoyltetrapeptide carboxypeptidase|uniref:LD-carboxypeptidase n=1 Tax=Candidatus Aquirickettsiella gammari TaxID=2016198 RepID=A0A370CK64_9COXI|nr:MAG: LD-carboxypeptidase [Candidatus Aquirickettsiella gammari]
MSLESTKTPLFKTWRSLKENSIIDIIAPASGVCDPAILEQLKTLLKSWQLIPRFSADLFGHDLLCANSDEKRFQQLQEALSNTSSDAIWCLRGGYGCTRLLPSLLKLTAPKKCKLFIGFSDITALHLFLQQKWHWQTLHGPSINQVVNNLIDKENSDELRKIIFGELNQLEYLLKPYHKINNSSDFSDFIQAPLTGGSLTLIQASLGTDWQIETRDKILFLEDVNESAYRIDRMLQHLQQSGIFNSVKAILMGDFIFPKRVNEEKLIQSVIERFASEQNIPVFHCPGIGHGNKNRSLPFAIPAVLDFNKNQLTIKITG